MRCNVVNVQSHLDTVSLYEPVCINDFAPVDHFDRRTYMYVYPMARGGSVGTLIFIWKNDQSLLDHDQ